MALNNLLLKLEQSGDLYLLFKAGFVSYKVLEHKDIYLTYDLHRKQGFKKMQAVKKTADQFELNDHTIFRIVKSMEEKE